MIYIEKVFNILKNSQLIDFYFNNMNDLQVLKAFNKIYPAYSTRRRLLKILNLINALGPQKVQKNFGIIKELDVYTQLTHPARPHAWLLHKLNQNGRAYFFEFDDRGHIVTTAKISINQSDFIKIENEYTVLKNIDEKNALFWHPKVIRYSKTNDISILQTTGIPNEFHIFNKKDKLPDELYYEIKNIQQNKSLNKKPAKELCDFQNYNFTLKSSFIRNISESIDPNKLFDTSAAHRDLGSENIFTRSPLISAKDCALIDWEYYTDSAPALTDRVGVWLGCHHKYLKAKQRPDIESMARLFIQDFTNANASTQDSVIALFHLADLGIDLARILIGDQR